MSRIPSFLRFATVFLFFSSSSSADQRLHSRHLLHQPFFPVITAAPPPSSEPPSPSPHSHSHHHHKTPPPHEKHLFSSVSNPPPPPPPSPPRPSTFFPSSDPASPTSHPPPSPPPPPHPRVPTFPANISSLLFPTHNKPRNNHHTAKLLAVTISLVVSAAILLSLLAVVTIFLRRTRHRRRASPANDAKSTGTDSRHLFNAAPSDGSLKHKPPPKYTSSNTSSEFLYLGTLVNSGLDQQKSPISVSGSVAGVLELPPPAQASSSSSSSSYSQYQKLGSPELRPLPPLPKLPVYSPNYRSTELLNPKRQDFDGDDNENDEFYSPSGSPGRKQSPPRVWAINGSNSCSSSGSPATSSKPKSVLSPRLSLNSQNSSNGGVLKKAVPTRPPPPPPPPPLPTQIHEIPATTSLSPPSDSDKKEESLKPKLKPLHWDKARASSSRVTVWDQIKSNSFQ